LTNSPVFDNAANVDMSAATELQWFAIHTRTRFEKKVLSDLNEKGIESFLPLYASKHKWSDRQAVVQVPVFPGYVFVRISTAQDARIPVLRTVGVTSFVGTRGIGTPIPNHEIQAVQTLLEQRIPFQLYPFLNVGDRVRIRGGCLDGVEGILSAINGSESLIVSVQLIQRSIAMQISGYEVEPVRTMVTPAQFDRINAKNAAQHAAKNTREDSYPQFGQRRLVVSHS
jgi:transcription antitermination factor NusG